MEGLYSLEGLPLENGCKKLRPIVLGYNDGPILSSHQLCVIDHSRSVDHPSYVCQTSHFGAAKLLFEQSEAPVRCKFGVANQKKRNLYPVIESGQNSPRQILHHKTILVLAGTVVSMEVETDFTKVVVGEEVVKETDYAVPTLPNVHTLINEVIDLCV